MEMLASDLLSEFDRQVKTIFDKGYLKIADISEDDFLNLLAPLKEKLTGLTLPETDFTNGTLPFVIVISSQLVPTEKAMELVDRQGKHGVTKLFPHTPTDFLPVTSLNIPANPAYVLLNIDRGKETLNVPPNQALLHIKKEGRSPLTIDEGVAIVTQYPDFLMKNNCFSLLGSRHEGDKRVPAIWINSMKEPNLGWCWEGNPHTWLGSASCKARLATSA